MKIWLDELAIWFEDPIKRKNVLYRLTLKYWWCDVIGQPSSKELYIQN